MKSACRTENNDTEAGSQIFKTFGEVFPDGSLIELVASATGDQPNLLLWNGKATLIAPQVEHDGADLSGARTARQHCAGNALAARAGGLRHDPTTL